MKHFKNVFVILTLLFTALFIASCDGNSGDDKDSGTSGDSIVCTYYMKGDTSVYYVFYEDKTAEYHANGKIENTRSELKYSGDPLKAGTVSLKISSTGTELISFNVKESNGTLIPTVELVPGFPVEYTLTLDGENSGTDNESSPLMFMGFDNVVTIEKGTDITGITNTIYSLTSDTTLKFKGGINSITLTTIAAAMGRNDSVKIALDFSEATGITEWTNKLAGVKTLYAISLPSTVTSVKDGAFTGCTNLKAITVPKTTVELPSDLSNDIIINLTDDFWEWVQNSAIIPDGQTLYLNGEKLSDSTGSIIMPEGITTIPDSAFEGCDWLTSITIPEGVTEIWNYAFKNCTNLTTITIPKSVTIIGSDAFSCCSSLTSITIPNSVTSIGSGAFSYCSSLTSITIPNSVTSIGYGAFSYCSSLTSIMIPNSVTNIEFDAFNCCSSLTSITIPNSVTSIGYGAFSYCSSLTSITIPNSVTSIGSRAFSYCSSLTNITIPNSVTIIGQDAFRDCSSLTSITIPNSVTSIEDMAFSGCSSLTSITIPKSVTNIGQDAFRDCSSLTSITIPNSVTSIGSGAFCYCSSLTSITIPNSVTSIKYFAFSYCSSLTSITIPNSVTSIEYYAFFRCDNLTTINYRGSEEQWNAITIGSNNESLTTATIVYNYTGD
jgi:hypothetical protein